MQILKIPENLRVSDRGGSTSGRFHIPQKLYGREEEVRMLLEAFERVSQGTAELVLVSGYSGVGKSSLVREIHKPISGKRRIFCFRKI